MNYTDHRMDSFSNWIPTSCQSHRVIPGRAGKTLFALANHYEDREFLASNLRTNSALQCAKHVGVSERARHFPPSPHKIDAEHKTEGKDQDGHDYAQAKKYNTKLCNKLIFARLIVRHVQTKRKKTKKDRGENKTKKLGVLAHWRFSTDTDEK